MNDMTRVIAPKSDQLNSDDLIAGPRTITIRDVDIRPGTEQPVSIFFENDSNKPWKPCKSMSRVLVSVWGPDAKAYIGRSVEIYRDPEVTWGGMKVGGIRVSRVSHIDKAIAIALTAKKGQKAIATIKPLVAQQRQPDRDVEDDDGRSIATKKVEQYEANVARAPSTDKLAEYQGNKAAWIASLKDAFPDLHKRCVDAGTKRIAELAPPAADPSFDDDDNPFADNLQGAE